MKISATEQSNASWPHQMHLGRRRPNSFGPSTAHHSKTLAPSDGHEAPIAPYKGPLRRLHPNPRFVSAHSTTFPAAASAMGELLLLFHIPADLSVA